MWSCDRSRDYDFTRVSRIEGDHKFKTNIIDYR